MEATAVRSAAPTGAASPRFVRLASDARLVTLVRQGVPTAFEALYDRHHRALLSFSRQLLGDHAEAEDVVQHSFLAAYNDLTSSDKPILLRPWLFTIARNRCLSVLRARREHPRAELEHMSAEEPATEFQRRQDLRDLLGDLRKLPAEQAQALVLAELQALSHREIAEQIGVPREKVKALVFQARTSLQASRAARETACTEIRQLLLTGSGGALRRGNLRRHLGECQGCREFRNQLGEQRSRPPLVALPAFALEESSSPAARSTRRQDVAPVVDRPAMLAGQRPAITPHPASLRGRSASQPRRASATSTSRVARVNRLRDGI